MAEDSPLVPTLLMDTTEDVCGLEILIVEWIPGPTVIIVTLGLDVTLVLSVDTGMDLEADNDVGYLVALDKPLDDVSILDDSSLWLLVCPCVGDTDEGLV